MTQKRGSRQMCRQTTRKKGCCDDNRREKEKSNDMILDVHSFHSKELITILKVNGFNFFC